MRTEISTTSCELNKRDLQQTQTLSNNQKQLRTINTHIDDLQTSQLDK